MKGIIRLWRNECSKIFRQTANKIIIIIALVLSILAPLLFVGLSSSFDILFNNMDADYWESSAKVAKENGDWYEYSDSAARADASVFFKENDIGSDSWKYQTFFDTYADLLKRRYYEKFYIDNKVTKDDFARNFFWDFEVTDDLNFKEEVSDADEIDPSWLDSFDVEADLAETEDQIKQLENTITSVSSGTYAAGRLIQLRNELKNEKSDLAEKKALFDSGKASEYDVQLASLTVVGTEYMISFFESIQDAAGDVDNGDWMITTAETAGQSARAALCTVPVSEDEFNSGSMYTLFSGTSDYEQYRRSAIRTQSEARRALMTVGYSLEHGIQMPETVRDSTKTLVRHALSLSASLIVLAMVVITANNVATEYSTGTIRLLLIRPRSRIKIILSKFLAILTTGILICAAAFVAVHIVSVILRGVNDLFIPDLMYRGGVLEVGSILYSLMKMFLPLLCGTLLIAIAFMTSVLTRKAALAIVIPLAVNMFDSIAQYIAAVNIPNLPILKYTVLPYLDLEPFLSSPIANYSSGLYGGVLESIFNASQQASWLSNVSASMGIVVIIAHLALIFAVSFIAFCRQQIKN